MSRARNLGTGLVVILVIGIVYFGISYFRDRQQQQTLQSRLDSVNQMLSLIPTPQANLDQALQAAQNANAEAKQEQLPEKVDTTQIINSILQTADQSRLDVIPLSTDKWVTKTISGTDYRVLTISLSVEGDLSAVTSFVNRLYGADFGTVAVDSIQISNVNEGDSTSPVTGTIVLAVYTRSVD